MEGGAPRVPAAALNPQNHTRRYRSACLPHFLHPTVPPTWRAQTPGTTLFVYDPSRIPPVAANLQVRPGLPLLISSTRTLTPWFIRQGQAGLAAALSLRLRPNPQLSLEVKHVNRAKPTSTPPPMSIPPLPVQVKLGDNATPANVLDHLQKPAADGGKGAVSEELEALMNEPVEVSVSKAVRKMVISPGGHKASFEVTGACFGSFRWRGGCVCVVLRSSLTRLIL